MKLNLIGPFVVNAPFGTEIAFAKGLKRIGVDVVEIDPNIADCRKPDHLADATIVFKSCVGREAELLQSLKHPIVVYQPDDARFPHIRQMMLNMRRYSDLFLSFDEYGATAAKTMGYRAAETLLLTADDELYCPSPESIERDIDVCFIGSMGDPVAHASRRRMCEIVAAESAKRGWKFVYGQSQDIPKVIDAYRRSKVVINHATDVGQPFGKGYGIQCRHFEVGMTNTPLVSNSLYDKTDLPFATYDDELSLLTAVEYFIENREVSPGMVAAEMGPALFDCIRAKHMPEHRAAQLVDFIERNS